MYNNIFVVLGGIFLMIFGLVWVVAGPKGARRFTKVMLRWLRQGLRWFIPAVWHLFLWVGEWSFRGTTGALNWLHANFPRFTYAIFAVGTVALAIWILRSMGAP